MGDMSTKEWLERAYKKLKGSVYFDKTQLPLDEALIAVVTAGHMDTGAKITANTISRIHKPLKSAFAKAMA